MIHDDTVKEYYMQVSQRRIMGGKYRNLFAKATGSSGRDERDNCGM